VRDFSRSKEPGVNFGKDLGVWDKPLFDACSFKSKVRIACKGKGFDKKFFDAVAGVGGDHIVSERLSFFEIFTYSVLIRD
jgi:hypothetical protein